MEEVLNHLNKIRPKSIKGNIHKENKKKKMMIPVLVIGGIFFLAISAKLIFTSESAKEISQPHPALQPGQVTIQSEPVVKGIKKLTFATFPLTAENDLTILYGGSEYSNAGDLYEWEINGAVVAGESSSRLKTGRFKRGDSVRVKLLQSGGSETVISEPAVVQNAPPRIVSIKIEPMPPTKRDLLIPKITAADADGDPITYTYKWSKEDGSVAGTEANLQGSLFNKKEKIILEVLPSDGQVNGPLFNTAVILGNALPKITSIPASFSGKEFSYQVTAEDPDQDPLVYSLSKAPDGMTIDSKTGLIKWAFTQKDAGTHPIEIEVSDSEGAGDIQRFDLPLSFSSVQTP
jgi:hypothetical protein